MTQPIILFSPRTLAISSQGGVLDVLVRISAMRLSSRLSAKAEQPYGADETEFEMPAFLRKKSQEGRGRKHQSDAGQPPAPGTNPTNPPNTPL